MPDDYTGPIRRTGDLDVGARPLPQSAVSAVEASGMPHAVSEDPTGIRQ